MPHETPKEIFDRDFHAGRLVELWWADARPYPKDKFFLVAAAKPAPICLVVNSTINKFIQARPSLLQCQVILRQADYTFLDYDSYLNCAEAITSFRPSIIENQILRNPKRLKTVLTSSTLTQVLEALEKSDDIPERHKEWIHQELKLSSK